MWFKNLIVYRLPSDWSLSAAELEDQLSRRTLAPCGAFDMQSRGWVHSSVARRYVHTTNGQHLIALGVEQKLLPGSIIKQVTTERAEQLEVPWPSSSVKQRLRVTASVGVAHLRPAPLNLQSLVDDAEDAVQASRLANGNCVRAAPVESGRLRHLASWRDERRAKPRPGAAPN
jgi:hypothetical protein